jgi:shikimate dehydrogenase
MITEFTYTLRDLQEKDFSGTSLAVLGQPIAHSISPVMQNAAIKALQEKNSRFKDWAYYRFEIAPEELPDALPLFHRKNFLGLNLTVPHKVIALDCIQGISADGERMGAVNTLVWDELGYDGFNTDGYGLERGLEEDLGFSLECASVLLIGAGGAARAAAVQCLLCGCERLYLGNRSIERLAEVLSVLEDLPGGLAKKVESFALAEPPTDLPETGVLINATALGLKPNDPSPFETAVLPPSWKVYDMIYNPPATTLLRQASGENRSVANGLSMLVHQGARSLELWSHEAVGTRPMMSAALHALRQPPRLL